MNSKANYFLLVILIVSLSACSRADNKQQGAVVAYVNKEPIFATEIEKSLKLKSRLDPMFKASESTQQDYLHKVIDKKLIIQEALSEGLATDENFVSTIKSFWEQTLVREFIDHKRREFVGELTATDREIQDYYDNLQQQVSFKVFKHADKRYIENIFNRLKENKNNKKVEFEAVGPVGYEDIKSNVLLKAFNLPSGSFQVFSDAQYHYIIIVTDRKKIDIKDSLEQIKPEIKKRVIALKERLLFDEWLQQKRGEAKIKIIKR